MTQGSWKKHLLRSGVPLEYEVAQIFARLGMAVSADFSFLKRDGSEEKECSVDIEARWMPGEEATFNLAILTECKYRSPEKTMLFLLDPNDEFQSATLGGTVNFIDAFVPYSIPLGQFVEMEWAIDYVYKCIEIYNDGAIEREFKHGIEQIRYAIPNLIKREIDFNIGNHVDDVVSSFFANILVTNAPLRILKEGCNLSDIENAESLEAISEERDHVIFVSDYGPHYEEHFSKVFSHGHEYRLRSCEAISSNIKRDKKPSHYYSNPIKLCESLLSSERYLTQIFSTQFFIVNLSGLERLISGIQSNCLAAYRARIGI